MRRPILQKSFTHLLLGGALVLSSLAASAQPASAPTATKRPDFSGLWAKTSQRDDQLAHMSPLTPEGQRIWDVNKKGIDESDPNIHKGLSCMPPGFPRNTMAVHPVAIFQSKEALVFSAEGIEGAHMIYFDVGHNPALPPQIEGDAVGHWEGDTLVVDTVNIYDDTFIDGDGLPHSDALHVIQRFRLLEDGAVLEETFTIDDPKIFTKPWSATFTFERTHWRPPEKFCNEARIEP